MIPDALPYSLLPIPYSLNSHVRCNGGFLIVLETKEFIQRL